MHSRRIKNKSWLRIVLISIAVLVIIVFIVLFVKHKARQAIINSLMDSETRQEIIKLNEEWTLPENLYEETVAIGEMDAYWIKHREQPSSMIILNLHGGAYMVSLQAHHKRMAANNAEYGNADVLTIDYRTAPEFPYPAALDDAVSAYEYLLGSGYSADEIIVAGSSAGGGLSLSLVMYLRDNAVDIPAAVITMSAWTDLSKLENLSASYVGDNDPKNPYISPAYGDYSDFPSMLMQVGDEPVTDDSYAVYEKAVEKNITIKLSKYDNMPHVFQNLGFERAEVSAAWEEVGDFIKNLK